MRNKRAVLLAGVVLVSVGLVLGVFWNPGWGEPIRAAVGLVMGRLREAGPGVFFAGMALLPLFGFPLAPFTLAAGPVFGPQLGVGPVIACAVAAVAVNVTVSYWIAARALRPLVARLLGRFGWKLPEAPLRSALELTLLLRVVPGTPFFVQSYLLGMARVPFGLYLVISVGVPAAYIGATILAGDALGRGDRSSLAAAGVLCAVAGLGLHLLRKRLTRQLRERRARAKANTGPSEGASAGAAAGTVVGVGAVAVGETPALEVRAQDNTQ